MKLIKQREYFFNIVYKKVYGDKNKEQMYFAFECDENGNILKENLHEDAIKNLINIEQGNKYVNGIKMEYLRDEKYEVEGYSNPIGICDVCEAKIELSDVMTNSCDCGAEYNRSGDRLEDRRLWDGTDGSTSPDYE